MVIFFQESLRTHNPEPICPVNFEVGGIKSEKIYDSKNRSFRLVDYKIISDH